MTRLAVLALLVAAPAPAQTHLVVVTGIGGEPRYQQAFLETGLAIVSAGRARLGIAPERIRFLAGDPTTDPAVTGRATKEAVRATLDTLARQAPPQALILVVLVGHGSATGGEARINLPGPDLTAPEFAALLAAFPTQQLVIVNATSASGDWIRALAGPRRTVVTATRSGRERDETHFGRFFAAALASEDADRDKDGRLSVLEAFDYARREVARVYEREQRLRTEHALLDADGDGEGSLEPEATSGDGALAAAVYLDAGAAAGAVGGATGLVARRDSLQREVIRLRSQRESLRPDEYERRLEALLLELARVTRELRDREGKP